MADAFIEEFLTSFDDSRYPEPFLRTYELLECLSENEMGETLLIQDRLAGDKFVAKCYPDESLLSRTTESDLLKKISHPGLPVYAGEYQNEQMLCVVRSYAQGIPLDRLVRERRLDVKEAITIAVQLCDILAYLHGQIPPIIHRDIKPKNIIVDEDLKVTLIDFGASRTYNETSREDTLYLGTRHYAAPEQYGFSQTDSRTDIYSLGILLCWLLTGSVDVRQAKKAISKPWLVKIISRCTAFDPQDRYKNALQVRDALTGRATRRKILAAFCGGLIVLAAALLLPNLTRPRAQLPAGVTFQEPLIEEAVRLALGKEETQPITDQDLLSVSELLVFGNKAAGDEVSFRTYGESFAASSGTVTRGDIDTLEDLAKLKNLRRISLAYQEIRDLTPLSELGFLESIDLRHNPIEDVAPLAGISSLTSLYLFDTNVSDLTALGECPHLSILDIGYTQVNSTDALDGLDALQILMIRKAPLRSLAHIETHIMLEEIYLSETQLLDLSPLLALPRLKVVEVDENLRTAAETIADQAYFEISYQ